jgi:hypothetical protein
MNLLRDPNFYNPQLVGLTNRTTTPVLRRIQIHLGHTFQQKHLPHQDATLRNQFWSPFKLACLFSIALFTISSEVGCSHKPAKSLPPYLAEQMRKRPPLSDSLTIYPIDGPFSQIYHLF